MKRIYVQLMVGFCVALGISALSIAQQDNASSNSNVAIKPAQTKTQQEQKLPCMMPSPKGTPTPSPTPSPTPTPSGQRRRHTVKEITSTSLIAVMKMSDWDCDGISDYDDNCIDVPNPKQEDRNKNGFGDACEPKDIQRKPNRSTKKTKQ